MANPFAFVGIRGAPAALTGRKVYRDRLGRFTTREKFQTERRKESWLRSRLGAPPAGKSWLTIAAKYPERFEDYAT